MASRAPTLSKSRYTAGLQCPKRLYLTGHDPRLADPVGPVQQAIFDSGNRVGALARQQYPGGLLVEEGPLQHARAESRTRRALQDDGIPAIFEAAFTHEGIRIRADVLRRAGKDEFDLIEVKSTTRVKNEHVDDVALQLHVIDGAGVSIRRAGLMHLNRDYVHPGGEYDLAKLLHLGDLTKEARGRLPAVESHLDGMWAILRENTPPPIEIGPHCARPYVCPFHGHCHRDAPAHPLHELYRISPRLLDELRALGLRDLRDLPEGEVALTRLQDRQCLAIRTGKPIIDAALSKRLKAYRYPVHFLDFETVNPGLPLFPGTHPYQMIPFQYSLHVLEKNGQPVHHEYLHGGADDPRPALARSLVEATRGAASVAAYSSFEATRLRELADALPDLATELLSIEGRVQDMHPLIRDHCYHPDFHGSFSIKNVLPVLVPGSGYGDLAIAEGTLAGLAYAEMIDPATPADRAVRLRAELLAYCKRDTEAMLSLFQLLAS
ncbi:MAG: DUF2779 domain-containing protein [Deltaproteobacteria bacterium]|nr:DUF2779 domain-containing protein [Deltaproteobacteria bacterium]